MWGFDSVVGLVEAAEQASDTADGWALVADLEADNTALGLRMGWEAPDSMTTEWEHELGVGFVDVEGHLEQEQELVAEVE